MLEFGFLIYPMPLKYSANGNTREAWIAAFNWQLQKSIPAQDMEKLSLSGSVF